MDIINDKKIIKTKEVKPLEVVYEKQGSIPPKYAAYATKANKDCKDCGGKGVVRYYDPSRGPYRAGAQIEQRQCNCAKRVK